MYVYGDRLALAENIKRYGRMCYLARWIDMHLSRALEEQRPERARMLLCRFGEEALAEVGEWVRVNRSRPIQAPDIAKLG